MKKIHLTAFLSLIVWLTACQKDTETVEESAPPSVAQIENVYKEEVTKTIVTNVKIPFDQTILVTLGDAFSEEVHFTGNLHMNTRIVPPNPVFPTDPFRAITQTNTISVQGVGLTSGATYYIAGSGQTDQFISGLQYTVSHLYDLLPPSPILPPNPIVPPNPIRFSYTIDLSPFGDVLGTISVLAEQATLPDLGD